MESSGQICSEIARFEGEIRKHGEGPQSQASPTEAANPTRVLPTLERDTKPLQTRSSRPPAPLRQRRDRSCTAGPAPRPGRHPGSSGQRRETPAEIPGTSRLEAAPAARDPRRTAASAEQGSPGQPGHLPTLSAGPEGAGERQRPSARSSPDQPWPAAPANAPASAATAARPVGCDLKKLGKGIKGRDFAGSDSRLLIAPDAPVPKGKTRKQNPGQQQEPPRPSQAAVPVRRRGGQRGTFPLWVREAPGGWLFIARSLQQRGGGLEEMRSGAWAAGAEPALLPAGRERRGAAGSGHRRCCPQRHPRQRPPHRQPWWQVAREPPASSPLRPADSAARLGSAAQR
ncbi:uncharacterized protein LOC106629664 [Zonotrichia albicollis]|uniref:uncharacterized protein LOC106629664 n=1 Tax=Zonotrichia albicollis TaxID=44394 RepID=UPI003D80D0EC